MEATLRQLVQLLQRGMGEGAQGANTGVGAPNPGTTAQDAAGDGNAAAGGMQLVPPAAVTQENSADESAPGVQPQAALPPQPEAAAAGGN